MSNINKSNIVRAIIGDRIPVNLLVREASIIAEASIRLQSRKHQHLFQFISGSTKQLALDAIAELFESNGDKLVRLNNWWGRIEGEKRRESEVIIEFRCLVGNQVNDYIFNRYKEKDPSLSKLIRNIKRVIKERMIDGLMLTDSNSSIHLETEHFVKSRISLEVLNSALSIDLESINNSVDVLYRLRILFENYLPEYYKSATNDVASAARTIFILRSIEVEDIHNDSNKIDLNLDKKIDTVILGLRKEFYSKYVLKEKLTSEELIGLIFVTDQILRSLYTIEAEAYLNFYQHTVQVFPNLSKEEYNSKYRNYLEYFVKLARKRLQDTIREELVSVSKPRGMGK